MNLIEKIYQKDVNSETGYKEFDDLGFIDNFIDIEVIEQQDGQDVHVHKRLPLSEFWNNYKGFSNNVELTHTSSIEPTNLRSKIWFKSGSSEEVEQTWRNIYSASTQTT